MEDGKSADSKTINEMSVASSIENVERKMLLLQIAENEKSRFDDVITGAESENGWQDCWKETENSVTVSCEEVMTKRSVPSEWLDEQSVAMSPVGTPYQNEENESPRSYYELSDLNREPVESHVRMSRVPSQYQLDALSEMFIFDVPQHYTMRKATDYCQPASMSVVSMDAGRAIENDGGTPYFVNSEYVSELLM